MAAPKKTGKKTGGWAYYNRAKRGLKAVLVFVSEEAHAKLKRQAFLEERTLQKVARRLIEEGIKDVALTEKEGDKSR
jgi:hypothetical protein